MPPRATAAAFLPSSVTLVLDLALAILATMTAAPIRSAGRFSPLGLGAFAYLSVNLGEKSDLSLLVGRRAAFFLSFFNFLVGFFSTLDFLVFLAILDFLRLQSRHRGLRCTRVKLPYFHTEALVWPKIKTI